MSLLVGIVIFVVALGIGFLLGKLISVGKRLDIVEIPSSEQGRKVVADILRERKDEISSLAPSDTVDFGNTVLRKRRNTQGGGP